MPDGAMSQYRLGRSVTPNRYELTLAPNLIDARFDGTEEIAIDVHEEIDRIVLNAIDLEIRSCWLVDASGRRMEPTSMETDEATERITLLLPGVVAAGPFRLHFEFSGILNDKLRGFYRSRYSDSAGKEHTIAATQFESTDARRAFPCFDEPDLKAVFSVTLKVDQDLLAVSNSPIVSERVDSAGIRTLTFADTIRMSTYLVAFVIGPLEATNPINAGGVPLRVIHPFGQGHLTEYALDVARFSLEYFAEYYSIPYPGQKMDLVALPDFAMGAMENFGCITFRETLLLVDPDTVTQGELRSVAMVIAHELAHMWFGDLVTMRWWNGIWLNEAFATFMELAAVDAYRPDWQTWVHFSLSRSAAFQVDALDSTRSIEYPVESPDDAEGMFDVLTYQKGASVLRMLEQYLGVDQFRRGIRAYLKKHSYDNTETADLWSSLEEASSQPVERIMASWVFQKGFPQVRIETTGDRNTLRVAQERFRLSPERKAEVQRWAVPMVLRIGFDGGESVLHPVLLENDTLSIPLENAPVYVVGNVEANGFYRVSYDEGLLSPLTSRPLELLNPIERFTLLDDAWSQVLSGRMEAASFIEISRAFSPERDINVWRILSGRLSQLTRIVQAPGLQKLQEEISKIVGAAFESVGWEPPSSEPEQSKELRGLLVETLCISCADESALARTRAIHEQSVADASLVEPNLAAAALEAVASVGTDADFARFVELSRTGKTPQERLRYLYALPSFPGPEEFGRALEMAMNGEVRIQNRAAFLGACLRNRYHGEKAWMFIRDNWESINSTLPPNIIVRMLGGVRAISRRDTAAEISGFFADHPVPQGRLMLAQHLELMGVNVAFRERETERLTAYLLHI